MKTYFRSVFLCFSLLLFFTSGFVYAAIELAVEVNPGPVQPNETVNIHITVGNSGNSASGPLVLQMIYPENLNQVSDGANIDGGDCPSSTCSSNELVLWQLGTMPPGSSQTVTLSPVVWGGTPIDTTIPFSLQVNENNTKVAETNHTVLVQNTPPFDIAVDEDVNPVAPGDPLVYTVTYSNRSSTSATNTALTFPLPQGVTFVSATGGGVLNGNTVEWNLNTLPALMGGAQRVTVNVGNGVVPGSVLDVDKAEITGTVNFLEHSSSTLAVTGVSNNGSMVLAMELNPDSIEPNKALNTALTVTNTTNAPLFGVTLELRYQENLNQVADAANIDGGDCPSSTCSANELVLWQLGTMAPGSSQTVTLSPVVWGGTPEGNLITFNAKVREDNGNQEIQSRSVLVQKTPPFDIAIDEDINPVAPGDPLVYTVTYSNRSSTSATNTALTFPLPKGVTFVSATDGGILNGNTVEWNLNTLPALTSGTQKITVNVDNGVVSGSVLDVNKVEIKGRVNFLEHRSSALATTGVSSNASMVLAMELNPDPIEPNKALNTALTVTNITNAPLFGITLELRYQENLNQVADAANIDGGDCPSSTCSANELVLWQLGTIAPGSSQTVTLSPVVWGGTPEGNLITFNAKVQEDEGTQALQSRSVMVQNTPPFDIAVDEDVNPVAPGDPLVYTVTYSNRSSTSATNSALTFPLPQGVTFVSATGGGILIGNTVEWNLNTLPALTGGAQEVTVNVGNGLVPGSILDVNKANITGTVNFLEKSSSALAVTGVSNNVSMVLAMELTPQPVKPNEMLNAALMVTNTTNAPLFGVTLEIRYQEDLNQIADGANIDGGDCPSSTCSANELVQWQLGTMAPNSSQTVKLSPVVWGGTPEGNLITFNATTNEDTNAQITASDTVFVGTKFIRPPPPPTDNCTLVDNPNQRDTNNDGFGNFCDPDLNNDGVVNAADLALLREVFFTNDADADLNGDGNVNAEDLAIMRSFFFKAPGPSSSAP